MANNRLEIVVAGDTRQLNQALGDARKATDDMVGNIVQRSQQATMAFGALTAAGGAMVAGFLSKAAEMEQFKAQLTAITGSAEEATKQLEFMTNFAASTPFDLPGVIEAGIKLKALGQDSEKYLPIAGNMAAAMGRSIPDAALALGKAMAGSQDGIQILADSFGITRTEMAKYGAEADKTGSIQTKTAGQIDKLKDALEKIIKTKFGNTMEEQAKTLTGAMSNLGDSVGQMQATFGKELAPAAQGAARALTSVVDAFKNMDPYTRSIIANGVLFGTIFTAMAAGAAALQTVLVPVTTFMGAFAVASKLSAKANTDAAVASASAAGAKALQAQAEVAAGLALVEETAAAVTNATTTEGLAMASQEAAIATGELAIAEEAATVANAELTIATGVATTAIEAEGAAATITGRALALMLSPFALILGVVTLVAAGLVLYTKHLEEASKAGEEQIAVSKRQLKSLHEQRDATLATTAAIKQWGTDTENAVAQVKAAMDSMGKTDLDLTHAIAGNGEILKKLREDARRLNMTSGNEEAKAQNAAEIAKYEHLVEVQTKVRHLLRGTQAAKDKIREEEAKKDKDALDNQVERLRKYDELEKAGMLETTKEKIAALDHATQGMSHEHERFRELKLERIKLERQLAKEEAAEGEKGRKEQIAAEEHKIALIVGNDRKSKVARVAIMQELVKDHRLTVDERRRMEVDLAKELLSIATSDESERQKRADDAAKKAEDRRKKRERDEKQAKEEKEKADKKAEDDAKKAGERDAKDADSDLHAARQAEAQAKKTYELDATQYDAMKKRMEERQRLERAALLAKAQAAAINANPEDKARILRDLDLDMVDLATKQTEEARKLTDEKQKQLDLVKATKKEIMDFTLGNVTQGGAGAGDFSAWDIKKKAPAVDPKATAKAKTDASTDAGILAAILAEMKKQNGTLESIKTAPVKVAVTGPARDTGAARSAGNATWKTSTNKTGE